MSASLPSSNAGIPSALAAALRPARSLGVITGAGISAASGLPTYRGPGGLYDDPEEGERTVESLSGPTLRRDPDRTWRAVASLARRARGALPNPAHLALAELEGLVDRFVILTQNVDGLHEAAGNRNIIDIHGNIFHTLCLACGRNERLDDPAAIAATPLCPHCGGKLRPDVVLFEELLPEEKLERIDRELIREPPAVVMAVGTTALFPYIAAPLVRAHAAGRVTVEINPTSTVVTPFARYLLRGPADILLPALVRSWKEGLSTED